MSENRRIPLDVLVIGMHWHSGEARTAALLEWLNRHPAVRAFGSVPREQDAMTLILENRVNTILLDPGHLDQMGTDVGAFIDTVRKERPTIVFVLYSHYPGELERTLSAYGAKFDHYFTARLFTSPFSERSSQNVTAMDHEYDELDRLLRRCEQWHNDLYQWDVTISYSRKDQELVTPIVQELGARGVTLFFDRNQQSRLVGKDLQAYLTTVYSIMGRLCIIFVSEGYAQSMWTRIERRAAQRRAMKQRGTEYIVPIRIDSTTIRGISKNLDHLDIAEGVSTISDVIVEKLWMTDVSLPKEKLGVWLHAPWY